MCKVICLSLKGCCYFAASVHIVSIPFLVLCTSSENFRKVSRKYIGSFLCVVIQVDSLFMAWSYIFDVVNVNKFYWQAFYDDVRRKYKLKDYVKVYEEI